VAKSNRRLERTRKMSNTNNKLPGAAKEEGLMRTFVTSDL